MPAGRPTVITPAVQKQIADCFFDGLTDEETAALCDINQKTIQRARRGEFCPAIKKAEFGRKQFYIRKLRDGKRPDWPRIAWFLERRYPTEFAKPEVQLQINTTNQTVNNTLIITAEAAQGISTRVKEADIKIEKLLKDKRPGHNGNGAKSSSPEAKNGAPK
jgi:hypothetical protein